MFSGRSSRVIHCGPSWFEYSNNINEACFLEAQGVMWKASEGRVCGGRQGAGEQEEQLPAIGSMQTPRRNGKLFSSVQEAEEESPASPRLALFCPVSHTLRPRFVSCGGTCREGDGRGCRSAHVVEHI